MTHLPESPDTLFDADDRPRYGTYRGRAPHTGLDAAARTIGSAGQRFLREKQWQWFAAANERIACGGTLLNAGYATTVFLWVFDRSTHRMIADVSEILPPFGVNVSPAPNRDGSEEARHPVAALRGLRRTFKITRHAQNLHIDVDFDDVRMELRFDESERPPMTAICPVIEQAEDDGNPADDGESADETPDEPRGVNVTQKQSGLPVEGRVFAGGRSFRLTADGTSGLLDYSHGLLARDTAWRWAIGSGRLDDGTPVGFNFSEGFNGGLENVVWLDDQLQRTDAVHFDYRPTKPHEPWTVRTPDGSIDLTLFVEGVRRHQTNFRIVTSEYIQPLGTWHGRVVDREVHGLFGVAESHSALW